MSQTTIEKSVIQFPQPAFIEESASSALRHQEDLRLIYNADEQFQDITLPPNILQTSGRWLLASDAFALVLAFICGGAAAWFVDTYVTRAAFQPLVSLDTLKEFAIFLGIGGSALVWLDAKGHYRQRLPFWEKTGHILAIASLGLLFCGFGQFVAKESFSRLWLGFSWGLFGIFLFTGRALMQRWLKSRNLWQIPAVLVGDGAVARAAMRVMRQESDNLGFSIVRQIPSDSLYYFFRPGAWKTMLKACNSQHIFLAMEGRKMEQQQTALKSLMRERLPASVVPAWIGLPSGTLSTHHFLMHDLLLMHNTSRLSQPLPRFLKRSIDIICASIALLLLSPIFAFTAFMVRKDGGPALFTQNRIGKDGKVFPCYKFRSMRIDAEKYLQHYLAHNPEAAREWAEFQKLKHDVRITRFGHFIRRTSIDELPQLLNVLKGHMSLVGPRPIMSGQEKFYGDDFDYYTSVRPGITGPWQVSGRNKLTFNERVRLECYYAGNWSLWMDVVILLKTFPALLTKEEAF